jgi:hypothetical protein
MWDWRARAAVPLPWAGPQNTLQVAEDGGHGVTPAPRLSALPVSSLIRQPYHQELKRELSSSWETTGTSASWRTTAFAEAYQNLVAASRKLHAIRQFWL